METPHTDRKTTKQLKDSKDKDKQSPPHNHHEGNVNWNPGVGYCKFLVEREHYSKLEKQKVPRKTRKKVTATKHYMRQYYSELNNYLSRRAARSEALNEYIKNTDMNEEEISNYKQEHYAKESQYLRLRRRKTSLNDFILLALLGKGGYGEVYLCRKVDTGEVLALKRMKKQRFTEKNEVSRVLKEREVMVKSNSPWLARLKYCFQSSTHLYMAMEYIPGGDLKNLLDHIGILPEDQAKFYFAEMLLAVNDLHQLGYIHRDLKPDNFMIDKSGHLKLIDFGLSKDGWKTRYQRHSLKIVRPEKTVPPSDAKGANAKKPGLLRGWTSSNLNLMNTIQNPPAPKPHKRTKKVYSIVGSPEYMAVEILLQQGYNNLVDYWSLGVILYEFVFGITPFGADHVLDVFENVKNWEQCVRPPPGADDTPCSGECWDLITKLICSSDKRLGSHGIDEIKLHPFFKDFNWNGVREMEPPFTPNLEDELDTSYFHSLAEEEESAEPSQNGHMSIDLLLTREKKKVEKNSDTTLSKLFSHKELKRLKNDKDKEKRDEKAKEISSREEPDTSKLKFDSSYTKFAFAGFGWKHEDLKDLNIDDGGGEKLSPRSRSNSVAVAEDKPPVPENSPSTLKSPRASLDHGVTTPRSRSNTETDSGAGTTRRSSVDEGKNNNNNATSPTTSKSPGITTKSGKSPKASHGLERAQSTAETERKSKRDSSKKIRDKNNDNDGDDKDKEKTYKKRDEKKKLVKAYSEIGTRRTSSMVFLDVDPALIEGANSNKSPTSSTSTTPKGLRHSPSEQDQHSHAPQRTRKGSHGTPLPTHRAKPHSEQTSPTSPQHGEFSPGHHRQKSSPISPRDITHTQSSPSLERTESSTLEKIKSKLKRFSNFGKSKKEKTDAMSSSTSSSPSMSTSTTSSNKAELTMSAPAQTNSVTSPYQSDDDDSGLSPRTRELKAEEGHEQHGQDEDVIPITPKSKRRRSSRAKGGRGGDNDKKEDSDTKLNIVVTTLEERPRAGTITQQNIPVIDPEMKSLRDKAHHRRSEDRRVGSAKSKTDAQMSQEKSFKERILEKARQNEELKQKEQQEKDRKLKKSPSAIKSPRSEKRDSISEMTGAEKEALLNAIAEKDREEREKEREKLSSSKENGLKISGDKVGDSESLKESKTRKRRSSRPSRRDNDRDSKENSPRDHSTPRTLRKHKAGGSSSPSPAPPATTVRESSKTLEEDDENRPRRGTISHTTSAIGKIEEVTSNSKADRRRSEGRPGRDKKRGSKRLSREVNEDKSKLTSSNNTEQCDAPTAGNSSNSGDGTNEDVSLDNMSNI